MLAGPGEWDAAAWRVDLPAPRRTSIADYRVAICPDDAFCPVDSEIADAIGRAGDALAKAGATVRASKPAIDFADSFRLFYRMLAATLAPGYDEGLLEQLAIGAKAATDQRAMRTLFMQGATMRHVDYVRAEAARQEQRARWADFFTGYDVFLCPIMMTAAFAHDHSPDKQGRRLTVNGMQRGYLESDRLGRADRQCPAALDGGAGGSDESRPADRHAGGRTLPGRSHLHRRGAPSRQTDGRLRATPAYA